MNEKQKEQRIFLLKFRRITHETSDNDSFQGQYLKKIGGNQSFSSICGFYRERDWSFERVHVGRSQSFNIQ